MKEAFKNIARMMHQSDPKACFAIEFWDGDEIRFGDVPRVTLRLKTKSCARNIIGKGFFGFGESYMEGDLEIENDMPELFRLGLAIDVDNYKLPLWQKFISSFFKKVSDLLKTGGLGLLHTIGKDAPSPRDPWIFNYIFPGGYLPTLYKIAREMGKTDFSILDVENLRLHYAKTLEKWTENYEQNVEKIRELFDEAFVRRWRLFLNSSTAGFKYGESRLFQVLFSNGLNNALPTTREHVYHY